MSNYSVNNNTKEFQELLAKAKERGLKSIGLVAEGHAKRELTKEVYTGDKEYPLTGLLRNSITHALSGKPAAISSYQSDDGDEKGSYEGSAPSEGDAVYVGTNVVYAAGIELGKHRKAGAVHFLKKAATEHSTEYKTLMQENLKNA